jgi:hypothetical protein
MAPSTNGQAHDNGTAADEAVDLLYSFWPGAPQHPSPCQRRR